MEFREFRGMMPIMPTTIDENCNIDIDSTNRVVDYLMGCGAVAIGHLAGASEHGKVPFEDRELIIRTVVDRVAGRVPTFFGCAAANLKDTIRNAKIAEANGADMLMICSPTYGHCDQPMLFEYYKKTCEAVKIPVIVQDTGGSSGCYTPEFMLRLFNEIENVGYVKAEGGNNWLEKMHTLTEISEGKLPIIGGAAGMHMIQMLRLGVKAYMTGTEACEFHSEVVNAWLSGDEDLAVDLYFTLVWPYLEMYTMNNRAFLKYMLKKRGIVTNDAALAPMDYGPADPWLYEELDWILERTYNNKIKCGRHK